MILRGTNMIQKKIRVLYVNTKFCGGGAEKVARQLYEGESLNPNIETFFMEGRKTNQCQKFIYPNKGIMKIINSIKSYMSNNQRIRDHYATKKIIKVIKKYKIDVIHIHNIHGNYMGIKDILEIQKYCKIIWTLHDMWLLTGHCAHSIDCSKWYKEECKQCNRFDLYPMIRKDIANKMYMIKKSVIQQCNITYILPSKWLWENCNRSFLKEKPKKLIYNGVNTLTFIPKDKGILREKYKIGNNKFVLTFGCSDLKSSYKGMDIIIKALEEIKDKERYSLVFFGNKNNIEFNSKFECHHVGYIQNEAVMNEIYSLADIFILPSIAETFPCSILESFAAGTPVIASDVGGVSEQINKSTGWLFKPGNVMQLTKLIEEACTDRMRLETMGVECRNRVEELFSEKQMLEEYKKLYERIAVL